MKTFYQIPWWDLFLDLSQENVDRYHDVRPDPKILSVDQRWAVVREWRNRLLFDSDWTQLLDSPVSTENISLWRSYRQELRDIPQNFKIPTNVVFPDGPEL